MNIEILLIALLLMVLFGTAAVLSTRHDESAQVAKAKADWLRTRAETVTWLDKRR